MITTELLPPLSSSFLLILGIIVNLVFLVKHDRWGHSFKKINFIFTLLILGLIAPHYYYTFKLDAAHFLEHSFLKLLFVLGAVNLIFLLGTRPSQVFHISQYVIDEATLNITSKIDDNIEELSKKVELEVFNTGISQVYMRTARFLEKINQMSSIFDIQTYTDNAPRYIQNVLDPIEKKINWLWTLFASKSETVPNILSSIQTGLLNNNLMLVLGFLAFSLILMILVGGG